MTSETQSLDAVWKFQQNVITFITFYNSCDIMLAQNLKIIGPWKLTVLENGSTVLIL